MTESGSELAESVLELHFIPSEAPEERSDEGNHTKKRGGWEMTESGLELAEGG